jgi:type I restriction enzyme R subunit
MPNFISEDQIEQGLLQRLQHLHGFDVLDCYTENAEDLNDGSGRADKREVIFHDRLKAAVLRLNPGFPEAVIDEALARLTDPRRAMSSVAANRECYGLLRYGIPVDYEDEAGKQHQERLRVIDFDDPSDRQRNEYLAVSQLWIKGEHGFRRPDVLLYGNGLPLVFLELKNSNVKLKTAFDDNLTRYKEEIPKLFLANAFCILSNAIETRVGSLTAAWEHFFAWLRVEDEKEKIDRAGIAAQGTSLERVVASLCAPLRLLDYVENFIVFHKERDKIIAQNHQFIGVNNAFAAFQRRRELAGRLGVFWQPSTPRCSSTISSQASST